MSLKINLISILFIISPTKEMIKSYLVQVKAESAKLMVAADERERALRLHFEQVRLLVSTQHVHSRLD